MKIGKKFLIYIGIGIYVIVAAASAYILFGKLDEKELVNEQLTQAKSNLEKTNPAKLTAQRTELEEQLIQLTLQTDALKRMMSREIANVAASTIVFDIANAEGIDVIELSSPSASTDLLENVQCTVVSLTATVEGDVDDLVSFITRLNTYLTTGVITSVSMNIPELGEDINPTATISLLIYNYQNE